MARPPIRYHGGKWRLAPWIISRMPPHRIYVEPFCGGASVLLRKPRVYSEIINDLDGEVVNLFRVLRDADTADCLLAALELTPFSREEFDVSQDRDDTLDPVERARRMVVRAHMGFGSGAATERPNRTGFRATGHRSGTTPAHDWARLPNALRETVCRLRGVVIENRPANEVIQQQDHADALFYVDPPYLAETRKRYRKHGTYRHEMSTEEHRNLAAVLQEAKGAVLLSGYPSPLYESLYEGWWREERATMADGAQARTEVLWCNRRPEGMLF